MGKANVSIRLDVDMYNRFREECDSRGFAHADLITAFIASWTPPPGGVALDGRQIQVLLSSARLAGSPSPQLLLDFFAASGGSSSAAVK